MNYRHIYHAGNVCDVVKHVVFTHLLTRYRAKETPFCVIDTHAGCGCYDLNDPRALQTGEASDGIQRLLAETPQSSDFSGYLDIVRALNKDTNGMIYPGSPLLARRLLRPQDRLIACELHPDDLIDLKRIFRLDKQVNVHGRNGYEALKALVPPKEKRGIVLIDPPFEKPDEFQNLTDALFLCAKRWPQACVMIWYPVKERPRIWRFHENLAATGLAKILCAEFIFNDESDTYRLNGSGLILFNPPWQFDNHLAALFPILHQALQTKVSSRVIKWLNRELSSVLEKT